MIYKIHKQYNNYYFTCTFNDKIISFITRYHLQICSYFEECLARAFFRLINTVVTSSTIHVIVVKATVGERLPNK